jgi:hypothetical protein
MGLIELLSAVGIATGSEISNRTSLELGAFLTSFSQMFSIILLFYHYRVS